MRRVHQQIWYIWMGNVRKCIRVLNLRIDNCIVIPNKFRLDQSVENWILQKRIGIFPTPRRKKMVFTVFWHGENFGCTSDFILFFCSLRAFSQYIIHLEMLRNEQRTIWPIGYFGNSHFSNILRTKISFGNRILYSSSAHTGLSSSI